MALRWLWDEKCGEAIFKDRDTGKEYTKTLYEGNAFLIFLNEWEEDEAQKYSMYTFFADEEHAKICLGLKSDYEGDVCNILATGFIVLTKLRINKKKCRRWKKVIQLFTQAFDNLEIEIFSEEDKDD